MEGQDATGPVGRLTTLTRHIDLDLGSETISLQSDIKGASPIRVHEHLIRQRSKSLARLIDNARSNHGSDVVIALSMTGSALHRWCVWLYGQALRKHNEDPTHALADVGEIFDFSCSEEDYECANACLDAIRELLVEEHDKVTINLDAFVKFFDGRGDASQMFIDILVYSPCASSGKTREWLSKVNATECWASFFCPLSLAFATRVANEAAGKENQHPDIMARDAYHLPIEEDTSDESAAKSAKSTDVLSSAVGPLQPEANGRPITPTSKPPHSPS